MKVLRFSSAVALAVACIALAPFAGAAERPVIVPAVKSFLAKPGDVAFANRTVVRVPAGAGADLRALADDFAAELGVVTGRAWTVSGESGPGIRFAPKAGDGKAVPESYRVLVDESGCTLEANDQRGFAWATSVVLQMIGQSSDRLTLPACVIEDSPDYRHRIFMLDVARKPTPLPVLKDYVRMLAWNRMNEFHLHLSDETVGGKYAPFRVKSERFPGLTAKDLSYSKADLRELQDFARIRGVVITPEFDMPGHAQCFTDFRPDLQLKVGSKSFHGSLDVSKPETAAFLKEVLSEMAPLFDGPDIHIGTDEYRIGKNPPMHEAFRKFINTMNAHVRSLGKNMRIWSGYEHMDGTTQIDPSVIIDMWTTSDANNRIAEGHRIINSNQNRTYIVPGAHYYGVNNEAVYNGWEPRKVSGDASQNPPKDSPFLLGAALHVWGDQGPTGYTHNEIARLVFPSFQAFGEKFWGVKGFPDYKAFAPAAARLPAVPLIHVTDRVLDGRVVSGTNPVLDLPDEITLAAPTESRALPFADKEIDALEWDWTLSFEIMPDAAPQKGRAVVLSSKWMEIVLDYSRTDTRKVKEKDPATGETTTKKIKETRTGLGLLRAAGYLAPGEPPGASKKAYQVCQVYAPSPAPGRWTSVVIVGRKGYTDVYLDGKLAGSHKDQMLCPLGRIGTTFGESFTGKIRKLKVLPVAVPPAN